MPDRQALDRRLCAVERTLTDGDRDLEPIREAADAADRVAALESELEATNERVAELEAATQALRGYVGNVRSVNDDVAERADAALAAVERLESESETEAPNRQREDSAPVCTRDPIDEVEAAFGDDPHAGARRDDDSGAATSPESGTAAQSGRPADRDSSQSATDSGGLLARIRDRL